jgi:pimeloyl-ACP methyl ester carboxylesterase
MNRSKALTHKKWMRTIKVIGILSAGYALLLAGLWAGQRHLIFFPNRNAPPSVNSLLPTGSEIVLHTADGLELNAWWVAPTSRVPERAQAVLFAPGNGGNRGGRTVFAQNLADRGFHVLLLDYRGYGGNPGTPSAEGLHLDVLAAQQALIGKGFEPSSIIYFGESLGTGVVSRLANEAAPGAIVLRSPFTTLADVAALQVPIVPSSWLNVIMRDQLDVVNNLAVNDIPTTAIYGTADTTVPTRLSTEVANRAGNLFEHMVIPGAGHNDAVWASGQIADAVVRIADAIRTDQ